MPTHRAHKNNTQMLEESTKREPESLQTCIQWTNTFVGFIIQNNL